MISIGPKSTVASFDVDAQYGFTPACPDELPVPEGEEIVQALNQQAQFAAYRLGSKDSHPPHAVWVATKENHPFMPYQGFEKNVDRYWPRHCVPGTKGFQLIKGLPHPTEYDYFVWKGIEPDMHPYGACFHDLEERLSTGVIEFLQCKQVRTIIIGGLATDYCVKKTALQLLKAGFKIFLNLSACRGLQAASTQDALNEMKEQGVMIINTALDLKIKNEYSSVKAKPITDDFTVY